MPIPVSATDTRTKSWTSTHSMPIRPFLGCEFDRVTQQVVQDLFKTHAIGLNERIALYLLLNPDVLGHSQWMNGGQYFG